MQGKDFFPNKGKKVFPVLKAMSIDFYFIPAFLRFIEIFRAGFDGALL